MAVRRKSVQSRKTRSNSARTNKRSTDDIPELTRAEVRELERRMKDLDDRTRYVLVSSIASRVFLYYNITDDTFTWDEPKDATLFKRKAAATKIKSLLGPGIEIVVCRVDKRGQLLRKSVVPKALAKRGRSQRSRQ